MTTVVAPLLVIVFIETMATPRVFPSRSILQIFKTGLRLLSTMSSFQAYKLEASSDSSSLQRTQKAQVYHVLDLL